MAMTKTDTLNYRGELFTVGQNQTPFIRAIGGRAVRYNSFRFAVAQTADPGSASQPAITEDSTVTAGTPQTIARSEVTNVAQIDKVDVSVSYKKASTGGFYSGVNNDQNGMPMDEFTFQKMAALLKMAKNMEYSFLQGTYQLDSTTATAGKTRGLNAAISTNVVDAGTSELTKDLIDQVTKTMYDNGAIGSNLAFVVNAFQLQQISNIYGFAPMDRNIGGLAVKQVLLDLFGYVPVLLSPQAATDTLLLADLSVIRPVFVPTNIPAVAGQTAVSQEGLDVIFQEQVPVAAARSGFFYTQYGLDYGPETYHGKIIGLTTAY